MPTGVGVGAGPFYRWKQRSLVLQSARTESCIPSTPVDAKVLLIVGYQWPEPGQVFWASCIYTEGKRQVPEDYYQNCPARAKARHVREGDEVSIITYGSGVHWQKIMGEHPEISPTSLTWTLAPLDYLAIRNSCSVQEECWSPWRHWLVVLAGRFRRLDRWALFWFAWCTGDALCFADTLFLSVLNWKKNFRQRQGCMK